MILMKELKEYVSDNVKTYVEERKVNTTYEMATLVAEYALTHKHNKPNYSSSVEPGSGPGPRSRSSSGSYPKSDFSYCPDQPFNS